MYVLQLHILKKHLKICLQNLQGVSLRTRTFQQNTEASGDYLIQKYVHSCNLET